MRKRSQILRPLFVSTAVLLFALTSLAQSEAKAPEQSYDVSLQLIVGTSDASARAELPGNLAGIGRQLRSQFGFANLRVANTFFGRIANNGNYEYKSVGDLSGKGETAAATPSFVDWSFVNFRGQPTAKGSAGVQAEGFRFGARVPVMIGASKDGSSITYESIGVNLRKVGFAVNEPTLISTLSLPGAGGTAFLVMTAAPVEN